MLELNKEVAHVVRIQFFKGIGVSEFSHHVGIFIFLHDLEKGWDVLQLKLFHCYIFILDQILLLRKFFLSAPLSRGVQVAFYLLSLRVIESFFIHLI